MSCVAAKVSRSGYYRWLKNANMLASDYSAYLLIKNIFDRSRRKDGWRPIQMKLKMKGIIMNHKKIQRIKIKYGLFTKIRRANPYRAIMKKTIEHRTFENILDRDFNQMVPFRTLGTDITYLPFNHRMAYLSVVKDFAGKEIVAWEISPHLEMDLVLNTVRNMKNNPSISSWQDTLIHSDQGFHYTNPEYINMIKGLNMIQSMSRKGNCIDNAPTESFFGHLKDEVDYKDCKTFEEVRGMIGRYIHYYNHERPQWNLKKMTPVGYRNHLLASPG